MLVTCNNAFLGVVVLLALGYLSPYFNYIPEATLAAILICSLFTLLDFKLPLRLWHESKRDFCIWIVCFVVCVLCGVEVGLFVSIIINVLHLLFLWARPEIAVKIKEVCCTGLLKSKPFMHYCVLCVPIFLFLQCIFDWSM